MRLMLSSYTSAAIKRTRRLLQRDNSRITINTRYGKIFTQRKPLPVQPRTEQQEKNWSLFAKANQLVAADFANPRKRQYWIRRQSEQTRYKTARGLARAHYLAKLKIRMSQLVVNRQQANMLAVLQLALSHHSSISSTRTIAPYNFIGPNRPSWQHYSNVCWFRHHLQQITAT